MEKKNKDGVKYITIKKADLERRFKEYNEMYFGGVLPPCKFTIVASTDKIVSIALYNNGRIYISRGINWTDETLKRTLIHEMVHHYVSRILKPKYFTFSHGIVYRNVCRILSKNKGIKVNLWNLYPMDFKNKKKPPFIVEMVAKFLYFVLPF